MEVFEMQKEFDALMKRGQELIKMLKEERVADTSKTKRWQPKKGEEYWYFENEGTVFLTVNDEGEYDVFLKSIGNCFKRKEEAQKELDRRVAEKELLDMVDSKMSDKNDKWFIEYDTQESYFYPNNTFFRFTTPFIFSSKESCKKAIKQLGKEKLKLVFRID